MKTLLIFFSVMCLSGQALPGQPSPVLSRYQIFTGSVHAHTLFTQSHGAHLERLPGHDKYMTVSDEHTSLSVNTRLKPDWEKYQGTPSAHFTMAKEQGYDFYVTTDHSQESTFHPSGPDNPRSEEHTSELQSLMRISYAVFCLKKHKTRKP